MSILIACLKETLLYLGAQLPGSVLLFGGCYWMLLFVWVHFFLHFIKWISIVLVENDSSHSSVTQGSLWSRTPSLSLFGSVTGATFLAPLLCDQNLTLSLSKKLFYSCFSVFKVVAKWEIMFEQSRKNTTETQTDLQSISVACNEMTSWGGLQKLNSPKAAVFINEIHPRKALK